ncbi:MAG TPA: GspMb/PilO family protein [Sedimentisphaerales bacterium]|nr:GspMb/PilO family protein [Sedimentisphaerales bacterium]HQI27419.1 GspMb/PilO family protein [Sedimentisphaerales bacterium]
MARKLNTREKRMLWIGAVSAALILVFTYGTRGYDRWSRARATLALAKRKLAEVETDSSRQTVLATMVPVFETPEVEDKQKFLFRDRLHEQFKKAGINTEPLQFLPVRKPRSVPYRVLKIRCKGKCKFDQLLDFLANLKENPYLVGVEEMRFQCDTKEPPEKRKDKEIEIDLTFSTFVK